MKPKIFFITGNDTGVGKTVFAALLVRQFRALGVRVAGLKPLCSGGRGDARALRSAAGNVLSLDEVNPWHFRVALAPLLAARKESKRVRLREVVMSIQRVARQFDCTVVEGAGGLLSPLGEDFDSRDLIEALDATPIVVCPNRLGAVNQVRLTFNSLRGAHAKRARIVLVNPLRPDAASRTNLELLREFVDPKRIRILPWLKRRGLPRSRARGSPARQQVDGVCGHSGLFVEPIAAQSEQPAKRPPA